MAKNWVFASHRESKLREIIPKMVVADRSMGDFVVVASSQWTSPDTEKEALELRMLVAELDYRNHSVTVDPATGKQTSAFAYPQDVTEAVSVFEQDRSRVKQALTFPQRCRDVLSRMRML